jgi:uncharacterized protein (UPF0262 family)
MSHTDIIKIELDERTIVRRNADIEHERQVAMFDLLEENHFSLTSDKPGPYDLILAVQEGRLILHVRDDGEQPVQDIRLDLRPFRRIVKDYFLVCESYFSAIKTSSPSQIEAIDMGRRSLHNEGAVLLRERLSSKATMDDNTARRLFTLVCVLHIRG